MRSGLVVVVFALVACDGVIVPGPGGGIDGPLPIDPIGGTGGGDTTPGPTPVERACMTRTVATQPLRRLTFEQYQRTLAQLFGTLAPRVLTTSRFPETTLTRGFSADAENNTVNTSQSNAIEDEAERVATVMLADPQPFLRGLMPCTLSTPATDAQVDGCVDAFISSFGALAYRRPTTAAERAIAKQVYTEVRPDQGPAKAIIAVTQFFIQSPALLYRVERGGAAAPLAGLLELGDHELAGRLAFLFTDGPPDAVLTAAAERGELHTKEQVAAQARRLMTNPTFLSTAALFLRDWLHLYEANVGKDAAQFPRYTPAVVQSLEREPLEALRFVLERSDKKLSTLLGGTSLPVDATLAGYYGVTAPGAGWEPTGLPNRRGLLTRASVMAALAKPAQTGTIHRGNFFRHEVLCEPTLTLPPNVDISTPLMGTSNLPTARERLAPTTNSAECRGCHSQINPLGLALEGYDPAGQFRTTENGATIDTSGSVDVGGGQRSFQTGEELAGLIADGRKARDCYARQWFRNSVGRIEMPEDACSIATLQQAFEQSNGDLGELLVAVTQLDTFFYRRSPE
ncbi:MAG: DUF1592 domain-containing protein [Myxococcaceae bacterium]|nr:DUF1592 domain-containing protein [Myxococcaceae bacterium]